MELQAGVEPLDVRRDKATLKIWERMKRTRPFFWKTYSAARERLCTQTAPLAKAAELATKYDIHLGQPVARRVNFQIFEKLPDAHLSLEDHKQPKSASMDIALRKSALQTIHNRFPENEWLHVYTDGSSMPTTGNTGAGVFSRVFEGHTAVGAPLSCYDGEVAAVVMAVEHLLQIPNPSLRRVVFLVDSQAAILALARNSDTDCELTLKCRRLLSELLENNWTVNFQWIPSHVGVPGNEKADDLAKLGASLPQARVATTLTTAKQIINSTCSKRTHAKHLAAAEGKNWEQLAKKGPLDRSLPRAVAVASFRELTGHDYLAAHLQRIGVLSSSACFMCDHPSMVAEHLYVCPGLQDVRDSYNGPHIFSSLYWAARHRMAAMSRVGVG